MAMLSESISTICQCGLLNWVRVLCMCTTIIYVVCCLLSGLYRPILLQNILVPFWLCLIVFWFGRLFSWYFGPENSMNFVVLNATVRSIYTCSLSTHAVLLIAQCETKTVWMFGGNNSKIGTVKYCRWVIWQSECQKQTWLNCNEH